MWEQSVCHSKTPETIPGDVNGGVIPLPLLKVAHGGLAQFVVEI